MKRLVLAGAGHAHALVLRALVRQPMPGVEVVVISPEPLAPCSGMAPGWLSGHYRFDEIAIDFPPLAAAAGARWCQGEIHAPDPARRQLQLANGSTLDYDVLSLNVGSTLRPPQAENAQMLPLRPLAVDEQGFVRIDEQLRSVSHPQVFATGDCASWSGQALPKAGAHAVRMAPVLAGNLRAALMGPVSAGQLRAHLPQRHFLALLATGDGRAIASRGPFGAEGAWAWRWKDRIDRRFLQQFLATRAASQPSQTLNSLAEVSARHS